MGAVEMIAQKENGQFKFASPWLPTPQATTPDNSLTCCSATVPSMRTSCCTMLNCRPASRNSLAARDMAFTGYAGEQAPAPGPDMRASEAPGPVTAEAGGALPEIRVSGISFIKDDHGLADQVYAPFEARIATIAQAVRKIDRPPGTARYVPSISGDLETMRRQIAMAIAVGLDSVMVAPMIAGLSNFHRLVREHPQIASSRIPQWLAPPHQSGTAPWKAVSGARRGCGRISQSPRTLRLLPPYMPRIGAGSRGEP